MSYPVLTDILILGATGFTGRLIARYLSTHPQRSQFTLGVGGRSIAKLEELANEIRLSEEAAVRVVQVDLKDESALESVVKSASVVINAIGPYFLSGTPIVRLCALNGVHYLDLTGETHWHQHLIKEYDYAASRTGAIIVPSCAFNSVPADISVYLAAKALQTLSPTLLPGNSTTVYERHGGSSGGTAATAISTLGSVDRQVLQRSMEPYALSPIIGKQEKAPFEFVSKLSLPRVFGGETYHGSVMFTASNNIAVVQRTFGLFEIYHAGHGSDKDGISYGPDLIYAEFLRARNSFTAFFSSIFLALSFGSLLFKPTRYLFSKLVPKQGDGPSESELQKGHFVVTNITASAPSSEYGNTESMYVKTVIKGQMDPGYFSSAVMVAEAALAILLPLASASRPGDGKPSCSNIPNLTALAKQGGLLTPMSAFGEVLIKRMEETGKFEVSSEVLKSS